MVGSHGLTERLIKNAIHNTSVFKIIFTLKNELHSSTIALFRSKVHIHNLNELHIEIQVYMPPIEFTPWGKDINRGAEQLHAQWIIFNPKTKSVHSIYK